MDSTHEMTTLFTDVVVSQSLLVNAMCTWYSIVIRVILGGLLVIFGLCGNSLTIMIIRRERHKSYSMRMLLYLMIADSSLLCIYGIMSIVRPIVVLTGQNIVSHNLKMIGIACLSPAGNTVNQIIVFFTVIVTWQRYVSVHNPHKAKTYTSPFACKTMALTSIIFSIFFNLPSMFQFRLHFKSDGRLKMVEASFAQSDMYAILYNSVLFYLISYVLPVIALIYMAASLTKKLHQQKRRVGPTTTALNNARVDLTILVIVVACIFIVCQSFSPLRRVLMLVYVPFDVALQCEQPLFFYGPMYLISFLVNSACNFIVFLCCAKGFKKNVKKLLCARNEIQPNSMETSSKVSRSTSQKNTNI